AILGFPAMIRLLGDLELLADLGDCLPAAKVHLGLAQLLDDLLRGVLPAFRHSSSLLRRFLLRRLSFTLVQFSGGTPVWPRSSGLASSRIRFGLVVTANVVRASKSNMVSTISKSSRLSVIGLHHPPRKYSPQQSQSILSKASRAISR